MATWKVGVSKVDITPTFPVYLGGYGSRTEKHDDVLAPIFARALALEDASGTRAVQLSIELIGVSNELVGSVRAKYRHLAGRATTGRTPGGSEGSGRSYSKGAGRS